RYCRHRSCLKNARELRSSIAPPQRYSSVGRAAVSKTAGRGFESLCPCQLLSGTVYRDRSEDEVAGAERRHRHLDLEVGDPVAVDVALYDAAAEAKLAVHAVK